MEKLGPFEGWHRQVAPLPVGRDTTERKGYWAVGEQLLYDFRLCFFNFIDLQLNQLCQLFCPELKTQRDIVLS